MLLMVATWLARVLEFYFLFGALFAVVFTWRGASRIDPAAREGTWGFRLLVLPGALALWPLLLRRWISGRSSPPDESSAHRRAARQEVRP